MNASIISSSWVRLIYVEFCEITRAITTKSEHTDHWTKMLRPFALFSGSVPSRHIRSSAGFTITTCVFEFWYTQDCIRQMRLEGCADNQISDLLRHAADELNEATMTKDGEVDPAD